MLDKYILHGQQPVPVEDVLEWASWLENADRRVAKDEVGGVGVSTVFLGIDHQFGRGKPLLFETMIFGGVHDEYQTRCSTWEEAEVQHQEALALVLEEQFKLPGE